MSEPTPNSGTVAADDVLRVAELANLELTGDEVSRMQHDLNAILGYITQLNGVDTAGVLPMAQVGELLSPGGETSSTALRSDSVRPSTPRDGVMAAAPETDGAFFKVPRVIER